MLQIRPASALPLLTVANTPKYLFASIFPKQVGSLMSEQLKKTSLKVS